jgi:hypothetical protein
MRKLLTIFLMTIVLLTYFVSEDSFARAGTSSELAKEAMLEESIISNYFLDKGGFGEIINFITSYKKSIYVCFLNISHDNYSCQLAE